MFMRQFSFHYVTEDRRSSYEADFEHTTLSRVMILSTINEENEYFFESGRIQLRVMNEKMRKQCII